MNPFKFGTIVDGDYFTDRVEETALLKQKLDSENHIFMRFMMQMLYLYP